MKDITVFIYKIGVSALLSQIEFAKRVCSFTLVLAIYFVWQLLDAFCDSFRSVYCSLFSVPYDEYFGRR